MYLQCVCQEVKIDSLEKLVTQTTREDRVDVLNQLASYYIEYSTTEAYKYAIRAEKQSTRLKYKKGIAYSKLNLGRYYNQINDKETAKQHYVESVNIFETINHKEGLSECYLFLGKVYEGSADIEISINYYKDALRLKKRLKNENGIARAYHGIGNNYFFKSNFEEAEANYRKAEAIFNETNNNHDLAKTLNNIGNIFIKTGRFNEALQLNNRIVNIYIAKDDYQGLRRAYNLKGVVLRHIGKYDEAIESYYKCLEYYQKIENKTEMSYVYSNIANISILRGDYQEAIKIYNKCLELDSDLNDKASLAKDYHNIGSIHSLQGNYKKALSFEHRALQTNGEIGDKSLNASIYNNIGSIYSAWSSFDSAQKYYHKSISLNIETNSKIQLAETYNNIGNLALNQGEYSVGYKYYKKAVDINKHSNSKDGMAKSFSRLSFYHQELASYDSAMFYISKSLESNEELGNKTGIAMNFQSIAGINNEMKNYEKAIEYYGLSDKIYQETGNKRGLAKNSYYMAIVNKNRGNYTLSEELLDSCYVQYKKLNYQLGISDVWLEMGKVYQLQNQIHKSLSYFQKSLNAKLKLNDIPGITALYIALAETSFKSGNYYKAIEQLKKAESFASQLGSKNLKMKTYLLFSEIYSALNSFNKALDYHKLYSNLRHAIYNATSSRQIAEIQTKYESEKDEKEIQKLTYESDLNKIHAERERLHRLLIEGTLIAVLVIFIFVAIYRYKVNQLRFIRSNLEGREKERQRISRELHDGVGSALTGELMRINNLETDIKTKDKLLEMSTSLQNIYQEVRSISHDLASPIFTNSNLIVALENIVTKFNSETEIKIEIINDVKITWEKVDGKIQHELYRIIQEILLNAIKHSHAKEIFIQFILNKKILIVTIEDDGTGLTKDNKGGIGLQNIKSRVDTLEGEINIDSNSNSGTIFMIKIPTNKTFEYA